MSNQEPVKTYFDQIPFGYLVTFPNFGAMGYQGVGAAHVFDDDKNLGVIIIAKDYNSLQRFREKVGIKHENDKYWPLAVVYGGHVKWADPTKVSKDTMAKYEVPPPLHGEASKPAEEEDW
jgi:hypothetical protein